MTSTSSALRTAETLARHVPWRRHALARGITLMLACGAAASAGAQSTTPLVLAAGSTSSNDLIIEPDVAAMGNSPGRAATGAKGRGWNSNTGQGNPGGKGATGDAGGAGAHGTSAASGSNFSLTNSGNLMGGKGGRGGNGGEGGTGGNGADGSPTCGYTYNCKASTPGSGGQGGNGGKGGTGGAGLIGSHFTLINTGLIMGGDYGIGGDAGAGGSPGSYPMPSTEFGVGGLDGHFGAGGAGVVATGFSTIINSGKIAGHVGRDNYDGTAGTDGHAIDFSGGANRLVLKNTDYLAGIGGPVVSTSGRVNGGDTLELGMAGNAIFSLNRLSTTFIGFAQLAKSGVGVLTLNAINAPDGKATFMGRTGLNEGGLTVNDTVTLLGDFGARGESRQINSLQNGGAGGNGGVAVWVSSGTAVFGLDGSSRYIPNPSNSVLLNKGVLRGGSGGAGGNGGFSTSNNSANSRVLGGKGGDGGAAVVGFDFQLTNAATGQILGGNGGLGGEGSQGQVNGAAGVAIRAGAGTKIINFGTIAGGRSGDVRGHAIDFAGGGSTLSLRDTGVIQGLVVSAGDDTLELGGSVAASFNAGLIGSQYLGFSHFSKVGSANWTLTGNGAQAWLVQAGTLTGNTGSMAGNLTFSPQASATVVFDQASDGSYNGRISGDGKVNITGGGKISFTAANSHTGLTVVTAGQLALQGAGSFGAGVLQINLGAAADISAISAPSTTVAGLQGKGTLALGGKNLRVDGAGNTSFAGTLTGAGSLTKAGSGVLTLAGANAYSGGTQINAGVVQINSAASLGSGAVSLAGGTLQLGTGTVTLGNAVVLNTGGGTFQVDSGASLALTQAVGGSGGFSKTGAGTLALNAGLTTQQLALSAGTLAVSTATITAGGTGTMSGGSFSGTLVNNGSFSYSGGSFNGALTNASAGTLSLETVLRAGGAVSNQGRVNLGPSAGLVGSTLRNDGVIQVTGDGIRLNGGATLGVTAAGQYITHNGKLVVDNATLAVTSNMLNAMASTVEVKGGSWASFQGSFMGGQVDVAADSVAFFLGKVLRVNGVDFSGAGTKYYNGGLGMVFDMPGLMVDAGSVFFGSGNVLTLAIGGTTECTSACFSDVSQRYSHYTVAGGLALDGVLKLGSASGYVAQAGDRFDLLDWDSLQGSFSGIDTSGFKLAAGTRLDTSRLYSTGEIRVTAVPEPAHWAMLLAGLAGLGWRVRRQPAGRASA